MKLFLDTANISEIIEASSWGILDGVTTNPTHVSKEGREFYSLVKEICMILPEGEISVEATATDSKGIIKEAREIAALSDNVIVKIPIIKEGINAIKILSQENIKVNCTLCFSAVQALLAAKVGAYYISPFVGRLDAVGSNGMELIQQIRKIYDHYGFKTGVLAAALRHPLHVLDSALAGADVSTMSFPIMKQLFEHPLTDSGLKQFLADWEKVPKGSI